MNNIKLRDKVLLILLLPVLSIIYLSVTIFIDKYNEQNQMKNTNSFLILSQDANKLMHSLQNERYYAIKYLETYGKQYSQEFLTQTKDVDKNVKILSDFLKEFELNNLSDKLKESLKKYQNDINKIKELRADILDNNIEVSKVEEYYTREINTLVAFLENLIAISNNGKISKYAEAYIALSHAIEAAHNEKQLLEVVLEKGTISNNESLEFSSLITAQNTYINVFTNTMNENELNEFFEIKSCEVCQDVRNIRKHILQKNEKTSLLSYMKDLAGYGGLIHNFKNYVLRDDNKYLKRFEQQHTRLLRTIRKYKRLKGITKEEKKLLKKIQRVFDSYLLAINEVKEYKNQFKSIQEVDSLVKIDDSIALNAIKSLERNIYGITLDKWKELSTKRIGILESEQTKVSTKLSTLIESKIDEINKEYIVHLVVISLIFILVFLSAVFVARRISNIIKIFQKNLSDFFAYALREKDSIKLDEVSGRDEFGVMHQNMKQRVDEIKAIIEQDKKVVNEISDVMEKVANGFFEYSIHSRGATNEVESLRLIINKMLDRTKLKLDNVNLVLDNYARSNYTFNLDETQLKGMYGDMGTLYTSTLLLGQSSSELIAMITNAGNSLDTSTRTLTESTRKLSISSQEQASSLEETASSLEQITANIKNNNININRMSNIADELNIAAKDGNEYATKTATSMDDINEKVTAINDAISVIDQIAFQTNILSLNAAVEAATAGEAGKGFAVVAAEVRNLASRSAEAAKEIKDLVESATNKSNEGKLIVDSMISGYENLTTKVTETKKIIDNVTTFSKEQEHGIVQINQSITLIEEETQKNASTAQNMDALSKEASVLSNELLDLTSQASIDEIYLNMVHDMDLRNEVSKYKNDHINFKKNYYKTLDSFESCSVVDCKSCNMGKWILKCEDENRSFTDSMQWKELKDHHEKVHSHVQQYVDENHTKVDNNILRQTAKSIEESTKDVFDSLNKVLEYNSIQKQSQR